MTTCCESFRKFMSGSYGIDGGRGIFFPLVVLSPLAIFGFLTIVFQFLLIPIGQVTFASQMLAGIALGPSFLGKDTRFHKNIFPEKTDMLLHVFEQLGFIFMFFSVTARMDKKIITKSSRLAIVIGLGSSIFPLIVTLPMGFYMRQRFDRFEKDFAKYLPLVAALESSVSFPVVFSILADLKLLNSEIGRIALSSSLIGNIISWLSPTVVYVLGGLELPPRDTQKVPHKHANLFQSLALVIFPLVTAFVLRPIMLWMMKQTSEGKSLRHGHVLAINMMILGIAFWGSFLGIDHLYGPIVLGIFTPTTSPMGPHFLEKIQYFVWAVFMPCFMINMGRRIDLYGIRFHALLAVNVFSLVCKLVKLFSIIIPSLYCQIPFMDTLSLSLILNCRGIYDIQYFHRTMEVKELSKEGFSIMVMTTTFYSILLTPLMRVMCNNSKNYAAYNKLKIQHCALHAEFRILACIHEADNIPTIINNLQVSLPPQYFAGVYVMNLEEYIGRSLPLVIPHKLEKVASFKPAKVDPIINAFHHFEKQNIGFISVQCYTSIAPYASMHDDICSMAYEKRAFLIVIPFQKTNSPFIKKIIKNVLKMAPCSVGIMYDHGMFLDFRPILSRQLMVNVCVLFLGGPDDREALAYGKRMAKNTKISVTVIRFVVLNHCIIDLEEENNDLNKINDFKISNTENKNFKYMEQSVTAASDTAKILHSISNDFDLILVGRRHDVRSPILFGLAEWVETEELGVVGDLLASSDFKGNASLMVIQEQAS